MKSSIRDLKKGAIYYFLEADAKKNPETSGGLKIYKAKVTEISEGRIFCVMFVFEGLEKNEVFLYRTIDNPYCGDQSNEILDKPITLQCNHIDDKSEDILGTYMTPKSFMMSDSVENAIMEYEEFLNWSLDEYRNNKVAEAKKIYESQISWLRDQYLKK